MDASGSSEQRGLITSYGWNCGDETTGTGVTASHSHAEAGTYTVTLTVTDYRGATDASQIVTVPTTAFLFTPPPHYYLEEGVTPTFR